MGNTATTPKNGPALRRGASTRKSVSSLRHSAPVKNDSAVKDFGVSTDGVPVKQITITPELPERLATGPNAAVWKDVRAVFVSYAAALQELWVPGKTDTTGRKKAAGLALADIVLGYDNLKGYEKNVPYLGAIVGRVAGRIVDGKFSIPLDLDPSISQMYRVPKNLKDLHCLHGGL